LRTGSLVMKRPPFDLFEYDSSRIVLYFDARRQKAPWLDCSRLFRGRLDVHVSLAITTDGGAEAVA
jgi:hypothetical protein